MRNLIRSLRSKTLLAIGAAAAVAAAGFSIPAQAAALQEVMFVGNNWSGTATVIKSRGDFARIGQINVIPDKNQRLAEIYLNPIKLAYFLGIRSTVGEGHDQFVDDITRPPTAPPWSPHGPASPTSSPST